MKDKGVWLAAIVALLGALASNGAAAFAALAGLPRVLQAFATGLPWGLVSFALAFALAVLAWWHVHRRLLHGRKNLARDFRADSLALVVAIAATMGQTMAMLGSQPGALLQALMLGILAGLLAPMGGRLLLLLTSRFGL